MKRKFTVLALAFAMVLTMSASVFAAGGANKGNTGATDKDYSESEAKLVKYLQVAEGINLPAETFEFTFTPAASKTSDYAVPVGTTGFVATSTTIAVSEMSKATGTADADTNNQVGSKTIETIFANYKFPRAGEYTFDVAETVPAAAEDNVVTTSADGKTSKMTYSSDTYKLHLIVDKDGNIDDVTVQKPEGEKLDATVDQPGNTPGDTPEASNNGFTFTNKYTKSITKHDEPDNKNPDPTPKDDTNPGDDPKPIDESDEHMTSASGAFVLDKKVLGQYGDQTQDFTFTVKVDLPASDADFDLTKAGNVPTVTENKGTLETKTWASGATVKLKHDGQLNFPELPMGTKITVTEADVDGYTKVFTTSQNSDSAEDVTEKILVGEDGGYAICRNNFDDESVTPTGIIINNLPYVLLIGLALGGIVLFSRKRRYE